MQKTRYLGHYFRVLPFYTYSIENRGISTYKGMFHIHVFYSLYNCWYNLCTSPNLTGYFCIICKSLHAPIMSPFTAIFFIRTLSKVLFLIFCLFLVSPFHQAELANTWMTTEENSFQLLQKDTFGNAKSLPPARG